MCFKIQTREKERNISIERSPWWSHIMGKSHGSKLSLLLCLIPIDLKILWQMTTQISSIVRRNDSMPQYSHS